MFKISLPRYVSTRYILYPVLGLLGACSQALNFVPACNLSIYCTGEVLRTIQLSKIFPDSKTFVDLKLLNTKRQIVNNYIKLMNLTNNNPTRDELLVFLDENFEYKVELYYWYPSDFQPNPPFIEQIIDPNLQQFAKDVVSIWPKLGRKVTRDVARNPKLYSFINVPHGFIVPGGRFKELYYWDSYWIIRGLLVCNMKKTARGMIENFFHLVNRFGYIPNGSRVYYLGRSQPPLLTWMVFDYFNATGNIAWVKENVATVEKELRYWLENKVLDVEVKGNKYRLLRYMSDINSKGPRPESYYDDYTNGKTIPQNKREIFYTQIKSAAESGWDFSSRWFGATGKRVRRLNLTDIRTSQILPVDLNSIFAGALQRMGDLRKHLQDKNGAQEWWSLAKEWRLAIENVLWDAEDGVWYDYDSQEKMRRKNFYLSCAAPLWAGAVQPWQAHERSKYFVRYLQSKGVLKFPGGVPTSLRHTGEQWDYPNSWAPLQSMLIGALENSDYHEANKLAKQQMELWIRANYIGYKKYQKMFEKYSCSNPGEQGGGGEYEVQTGFGWTNGYVLELLEKYGGILKLK